MKKTILVLIALAAISTGASAETRAPSMWSGKYEANLRNAGLPISGGMSWATHL